MLPKISMFPMPSLLRISVIVGLWLFTAVSQASFETAESGSESRVVESVVHQIDASEPAAGESVVCPRLVLQYQKISECGDVQVKWVGVSDSRCPRNVQCIAAGQVSISLEVGRNSDDLKAGAVTEVVELVLRARAQDSAVVLESPLLAGTELDLLQVTPVPLAGVEPDPDTLQAVISIK